MPMNWVKDAKFDGHDVEVSMWDTGVDEDYIQLRYLSYPDANVVMICYSPDLPESLENVEVKWVPEVCHFCPGVPFLLVCCKRELREDPKTVKGMKNLGQQIVSARQGGEMAKRISAGAYGECSARWDLGVDEVFEAAVQLAFGRAPAVARKRSKECLIL
jgi:small GTP-binding protein